MNDEQAADKVAKLAEELFPTHPGAAAILFTLTGSLRAGPSYLQELWDATDRIARSQIARMDRAKADIEREIRRRMN